MKDSAFDLRDYRQALGTFLTGVTVVTAFDDQNNPRGFTANSFTSVSLDPPLILVCMAKRAGSFPVFANADGYAINILAEDQIEIAALFAMPSDDRFSKVNWRPGPAGHPVFDDAAAWLDCRRHDVVDAGDHAIMIGHVVGYSHSVLAPLGYSRGSYVSASLEREAVTQRGRSTEILAILERDEAILLVAGDDASLSLPCASHIGGNDQPGSLLGLLDAAGVDAELGFVFSVVDNTEADSLRIIYRGTAEIRANRTPTFDFYDLKTVPWQRLDNEATRTVIKRYVQERVQHRFGIYVGGAETGQIAELTSALKPMSNDDINAAGANLGDDDHVG